MHKFLRLTAWASPRAFARKTRPDGHAVKHSIIRIVPFRFSEWKEVHRVEFRRAAASNLPVNWVARSDKIGWHALRHEGRVKSRWIGPQIHAHRYRSGRATRSPGIFQSADRLSTVELGNRVLATMFTPYYSSCAFLFTSYISDLKNEPLDSAIRSVRQHLFVRFRCSFADLRAFRPLGWLPCQSTLRSDRGPRRFSAHCNCDL